MKKLVVFIAILFQVLACSSESVPKLVEKPKRASKKVEVYKNIKLTINPEVDVLFVVDDSGSMSSHQANFENNIDQFTKALFSNFLIDYHLGVITSDHDSANPGASGQLYFEGANPRWVEKSTVDGEKLLRRYLVRGTFGSGTEKYFETTASALSTHLNGFNTGFVRPDAYLAVVFLTDATNNGQMTGQELYDILLSVKGNDPEKVLAYAAFIPPGEKNCTRDDWNEPVETLEFLKKVVNYDPNNLNYFSLCSQFGPNLARIGQDLEKRIDLFLPLYGELPVVETIRLKYGNQLIPRDFYKGWVYDPERRGLRIGRNVELIEQPGADWSLDYIPAKME